MGRVEMIILAGAIMILGRYSLTVNSVLGSSEVHVLQSGYELSAASACDAIFDAAWLLDFDESTVLSSAASIPGSFTSTGTLGLDSGETSADFDDIDDYNNYSSSDTTADGMIYTVSVTVGYVDSDDIDTIVSDRTTLKKMTVTITSDYLRNDISFTRVFPYWR